MKQGNKEVREEEESFTYLKFLLYSRRKLLHHQHRQIDPVASKVAFRGGRPKEVHSVNLKKKNSSWSLIWPHTDNQQRVLYSFSLSEVAAESSTPIVCLSSLLFKINTYIVWTDYVSVWDIYFERLTLLCWNILLENKRLQTSSQLVSIFLMNHISSLV